MKQLILSVSPVASYQFFIAEDSMIFMQGNLKHAEMTNKVFEMIDKYNIEEIYIKGSKIYSKRILDLIQKAELQKYNLKNNKIKYTLLK